MTMSHVLCLLFFFSSIFMKSNGRDPCPPRECNGVLIKYPFWQLDETTSEQFCGYLGFGLNCSDNSTDPVLKLPKTSYSVHEIHYDNSTLKLIDTDVAGEDCPRAQQNFTVQTLPIYQTPFDLNLTFYYNCSSDAPRPPMLAAARIDCLESKPNISYVVETARVESTLPPFDDRWYEFCEDRVDVAVMKNEIVWDYVGMIREFRSSALNEGFLVQWETLKDCIECEKSEGRCGYNNTSQEFVCFCKDNMTITTDNQHCKDIYMVEMLIPPCTEHPLVELA